VSNASEIKAGEPPSKTQQEIVMTSHVKTYAQKWLYGALENRAAWKRCAEVAESEDKSLAALFADAARAAEQVADYLAVRQEIVPRMTAEGYDLVEPGLSKPIYTGTHHASLLRKVTDLPPLPPQIAVPASPSISEPEWHTVLTSDDNPWE
jgi:hypothetical protein